MSFLQTIVSSVPALAPTQMPELVLPEQPSFKGRISYGAPPDTDMRWDIADNMRAAAKEALKREGQVYNAVPLTIINRSGEWYPNYTVNNGTSQFVLATHFREACDLKPNRKGVIDIGQTVQIQPDKVVAAVIGDRTYFQTKSIFPQRRISSLPTVMFNALYSPEVSLQLGLNSAARPPQITGGSNLPLLTQASSGNRVAKFVR